MLNINKTKNNKSNKKNMSSVPLELNSSLIKSRTNYKGKNQYSRVTTINEMKDLNKIIRNIDYKNQYKLLIDIKENNKQLYLVEDVIAKSVKEAQEKFKIQGNILSPKDLIIFIRQFYRNDEFTYTDKTISNPKPVIAPYNLIFKDSFFNTDNYFGTVNGVENIDNDAKSLNELIDKINERLLVSIDFKTIDEEKVLNLINNNIELKFNTNPKIPLEMRSNVIQAKEKLKNAINYDKKIIQTEIKFILFKTKLEDMKQTNKKILKLADYNGFNCVNLLYNQRNAFNSSLPFGINSTRIKLSLYEEQFKKIIGGDGL